MRELVALEKEQAQPSKSKLTYPVKKKRPRRRKVARPVKRRVVVKSRRSRSSSSRSYASRRAPAGGGGGSGEVSFGVGWGTGSGVGFGSGSGEFNLAGFPFPYYLVTLRDKIALNWYRFTGGKELGVEIVVYFKVGRDGKLLELRLERSCGVARFDRAALEAIEKSAPFPPLPKGYDGNYLAIRVIFE